MKKLFGILLAVVMMFSSLALLAACGGGSNPEVKEIGMVTDKGDITDKSFNQTTWEAVVAYAEANNKTYAYYKPAADTTAARVEKIEEAIDNGAKIVVMPGYLFAEAVVTVANKYKDIKFVAIDCGEGDYQGAISNLGLKGEVSEHVGKNVYSITFQEEQAGYLAGYAATMDGETNLGFLGGQAVPAVIRFGFGYIQGINDAAKKLGQDKKVNVWYGYGGGFAGTPEITLAMEKWKSAGAQTVFASGGGIFTSVVEAFGKDGKLIGVDSDQSKSIPSSSITVLTSAMKGLGDATKSALDIFYGNKWDTVGGKIVTLGLQKGETQEYVGLPTAKKSWNFKTFTVDDYKALIASIREGKVVISNDITTDIKAWLEKAEGITLKEYAAQVK